ncbi:DUF805 domain-containing protein [Deinococcus malanensis]|uniref:DUF805 domain-containing protein n=1 Tax=Deinococcus malanensis TaxID=1706855 RepID=A0ABQ2EGK4_9DEIO|nr:DUF805 domain-containing protein [Deinococcus malanensis]GGK10991.1 DUF805 domain-containing protein [Deinococcus malanensis]
MNEYMNVLKHHYADFKGRARRREYWMFVLVNFIITVVLTTVDSLAGLRLGEGPQTVGILSAVYALAVLIPGLALSVRRLHDTGRSGWWVLLALVPIVGAIVLLVFYVFESQPGSNKWGPNPKEHGGVAAAPSW